MKKILASVMFWLALGIGFFVLFGTAVDGSTAQDLFLVLSITFFLTAAMTFIFKLFNILISFRTPAQGAEQPDSTQPSKSKESPPRKPTKKVKEEEPELPRFCYPFDTFRDLKDEGDRDELLTRLVGLLDAPKRTFRSYVAGTKYNNRDGTSRQEILIFTSPGDAVCLDYFEYEGEAAFYVRTKHGIIGVVPAKMVDEVCQRIKDGTFIKAEVEDIVDINGVLYVDLLYTVSTYKG